MRCVWSPGGGAGVRVGVKGQRLLLPVSPPTSVTRHHRKLQTSAGHVGLSSQHLGGKGKENQDFRANVLGYIEFKACLGYVRHSQKNKRKSKLPPTPSAGRLLSSVFCLNHVWGNHSKETPPSLTKPPLARLQSRVLFLSELGC